MENSLVTIIIPAYNASEFIRRSIDSCLIQTYSNVEVLVVNDGSEDDTEAKVNQMVAEDDRIKLISVSNGGVSRARNIGLDNASGEYITFLDADDCLCKNAIEKLMFFALEHSVDIVISNSRRVDATTENKVFESSFNKEKIHLSFFEGDEFLKAVMEDHAVGHGAYGNLYKKSFVDNIRFPEDIKINEDNYFMFLCGLNYPKAVYARTLVYIIFMTSGSASRSGFSEKFFDIIKIYEKKAEIIAKKHPELVKYLYNLKIKANIYLLAKIASTSDKKYKVCKKQYVKEIIKNKKYFVAESDFEKKFFKIIIYRLYPLYERYMRLKHKK